MSPQGLRHSTTSLRRRPRRGPPVAPGRSEVELDGGESQDGLEHLEGRAEWMTDDLRDFGVVAHYVLSRYWAT